MSKKSERLILVTGATGHQGGAVLRHLRERGYPTRALTRDPQSEKAHKLTGHQTEVVRGDLDDIASVTRALEDVYGVYSVQDWQNGKETEVRQGIALADAAARAGVDHFVYSSVAAADRNTGIPHFESKWEIEQHIQRTGMAYTILRPAFFMDNWLMMRDVIDGGKIILPLTPDTKQQMIAADDIGAFVALAFEHGGHWHNRVIELAGDEPTMAEIAQHFTRVSGHPVEYEQVPWEAFEKQMGHEMTIMYRWFQDHGYTVDIDARRAELPGLLTLDRWLDQNWHKKQQSA